MSGQQWGWNLDVKASERAGRWGEGVRREGGREAARCNTVVHAALLLAVNTPCPCPGHVSGASFFSLSLSSVSMFTCAPMCRCLVLLVSCSLRVECLVMPGSAPLNDKQQLLRLKLQPLISHNAPDRRELNVSPKTCFEAPGKVALNF